jgi:hypothetical protein
MLQFADFLQNCELLHLVEPFKQNGLWVATVSASKTAVLSKFSAVLQYSFFATSLDCSNGTFYIFNTHLHLLQRLRISGAMHLLLLYFFVAWTETTFPPPFTLHLLIFMSCFVSPLSSLSAFKLAATPSFQLLVCFVVRSSSLRRSTTCATVALSENCAAYCGV